MTDEIIELYKNAGIECEYVYDCGANEHRPPFTAEKQLNLIKWLAKNTYRNYFTVDYYFNEKYWRCKCNLCVSCGTNDFENALASVLNALWQDLSAEEKMQIKDILQ